MTKYIIIGCKGCNKERVIDSSKNNVQKYKITYPECSSCSRRGKTNHGSFIKGSKPWNKNTKGIMQPNVTSFKKGQHASINTEFMVNDRRLINENNSNWKGDDVGYYALHAWIRRKLGKAMVCSDCYNTIIVHWANISGEYHRDLEDWEELCITCHFRKDRATKWGMATAKYPELRSK